MSETAMPGAPVKTAGAAPLLKIDDLTVAFDKDLRVVQGVTLTVDRGEVVCVVGESGSGKSITSFATMGLLPKEGRIVGGSIRLEGTDLSMLTPEQYRNVRGREMAMIFQEPGTSLNPLRRVGDQIADVYIEHAICDKAEAGRRAISLMERVGIPNAPNRARNYPHQLSGGMKQRVMIAMALACNPKLLIADEPTTALDVTIQAQILNLLLDLRDATGMGILLITHDIGVVAHVADRVVVMYSGQVVETCDVAQLTRDPEHPYTWLLMQSVPSAAHRAERLFSISGSPPIAGAVMGGCRFAPRCPAVRDECHRTPPRLDERAPGHWVRCLRRDAVAELKAAARAEALAEEIVDG